MVITADPSAPMKIMIVEDHLWMRKQIRELLARPGLEIRECGTGEAAVRGAMEFEPDWIIMDVHLPGITGFEAAESIRKELPQVRMVIISTDDRNYLREAAYAVGAEEFLSKFRLTELPGLVFADPAGSAHQ
jgi:two-component system KDP operon response regulator KdpE